MHKTECMAMILAGGKGSRLGALTKHLAKPGVLFGSKYRIIDFPLSNCRNSGITTVGILTQYQPLELNWYIGNGNAWDLDAVVGGTFILPPYMGDDDDASNSWYQGTADAIYQNLNFVDLIDPDYVLILSGDHIYAMDYDKMLSFHKAHKAAVTVSTIEVPWEEASRFGIMAADASERITEFKEKPSHPKSNKASMGIYIFNKDILVKYLKNDAKDKTSVHDFGKNIIPNLLANKERLYSYTFPGYWKDVGTIESLWEANMDLLEEHPKLQLDNPKWRIYSGNRDYPPHYAGPKAKIKKSLVGEGSQILGTIDHSVIFYDVIVAAGAKVSNSVVMPGTVIEKGAVVDNAIVGESCHIYEKGKVQGTKEKVFLLGHHKNVHSEEK